MTATLALADVLAAVGTGAGSAAEVARRTGCSIDVAEAALLTLAGAGRVRRVLVFAPDGAAGACGSCAAAPGCPAVGGSSGAGGSSVGGCAAAGAGSLVGSGLTAWRLVER
ncbi:MAG: hypothetical protein MUD13_05520 [Candidatus Nanopelagicales bacterium]|nr:hypothetical protein [Candidatus Nanopelagicales bacterium]